MDANIHSSAFPRSYEVDIVRDLPNTSMRRVYFPGGSELSGRDGLVVSVRPFSGPRWFGVFGFGGGGMTALSSTPDINTLLVVSQGAGYFVKADNPEWWRETDHVFPVIGLHAVPALGRIVLHDHTTVAAFGAGRILWRTGRLSFDGIVIHRIGADYIDGEGWDPTSGVAPTFRINTMTGEYQGGANPDERLRRK